MSVEGIMVATRGWTGGSIYTEVGSGATWTPDTDVMTLAEAAQAFCEWVMDSANRPWGVNTTTYELVAQGDRIGVNYTCSLGFDELVTDAVLDALHGTNQGDGTATSGAYGTLIPASLDCYNWSRWPQDDGGSSASGSWSNGLTVYSVRRPSIGANLTASQSYWWRMGMRYAPQAPLRGSVYHAYTEQWRDIVIGQIGIKDSDSGYQRMELEALS